jgi:hypothetical protein
MGQPGTVAQLRAGALDRVIHGRVDLVLDGAVACPPCGHAASPIPLPERQHRSGRATSVYGRLNIPRFQ